MRKVYEPAFPVESPNGDGMCSGMDLRDYFAAAALQGLLCGQPDADCDPSVYAYDAYIYADAMLRAREAS